jgi:hypothetical protein
LLCSLIPISRSGRCSLIHGTVSAVGLFVLAGLAWIGTRWLALAGTVAAMGLLTLLASYAAVRWQ